MFAIVNQNGALWGLDLFDTKDAATKEIRTLGCNVEKFTIVPLEPWQRTLIDALRMSHALNARLRATEPCPPADERIVARYIDGMDRLGKALRSIADGANDPARIATDALAMDGAALLAEAA